MLNRTKIDEKEVAEGVTLVVSRREKEISGIQPKPFPKICLII